MGQAGHFFSYDINPYSSNTQKPCEITHIAGKIGVAYILQTDGCLRKIHFDVSNPVQTVRDQVESTHGICWNYQK